MGRVGFWRHIGNNGILFLRRMYANLRYFVSKSLQNARKICCWRLQQYRMRRIVYSSSFNTSTSMKLDQKREKDQRSGLICAKLKPGFLRSRVRYYCKNLEIFMAYIFFSISSGKHEIVKVLHKTRIWDKQEAISLFRTQTILRVPDKTI